MPAAYRPKLSDVLTLAAKSCLYTTGGDITLLVRDSAPAPLGRSGGPRTKLLSTGVPRVYVPHAALSAAAASRARVVPAGSASHA